MRSRYRQHHPMSAMCHRWLLACLFWLALTLLAAGAILAQVAPRNVGVLAEKALRDPALYIAQHLETVADLSAAESEEALRELESLGVSPGQAFLDRRGGRWATLLTSVPLLPGEGVGNNLDWQDVVGRTSGSTSLKGAVWQAVEEWIRDNAIALAIDLEELAGSPRIAVHEGGELIQIHVGRQIDGVPVRDSYLTAVLNHGNMVLFGAHNWGEVRVETQPQVSSSVAETALHEYLTGLEMGGDRQDPELILVPVAAGEDPRTVSMGEGYRYHLVWVLRPELPGRLGRWEALIDAHSGEMLSFVDRLSYATTRKIVGGVYPVSNDGQPPDGSEQSGYPMPHADLATANGALFTDTGGNYPVCVYGDVSTTLSGRFIRIDDFCGPFSESSSGDVDLGTSGGIDCEVPSGSDSLGNTHAARTAFFELNRIAEQARGYLPDNEWLQRQLTAVTNIPDLGYPEFNCNAFWDETTVNFFTSGSLPSGPDCSNTGELAGVLDHEWGHGLDDNDNIPTISNPGEGVADVYAALRLNDSCIARGFYTGQNYCGDTDPCTSCDGVRDIDFAARTSGQPHDLAWIDDENNCAPPFLGDVGPCGGSIHCEGAVYAEAVWDLVQRDLRGAPFNMDLNTALEVGTRLTYLGANNVGAWYTCANDGLGTGDGCNADGGYLNYLAADDDNGNLGDGTPHMEAILAAFDRHGIACTSPDPDPLNSGCSGAPTAAPVVVGSAHDRSAHLTWNAVTGATRYQIFRTEGVFGCDFGKVKVGETTDLELWDEGLLNGMEYYYTVMAVGGSGSCLGPASSCTAVTPAGGANLGFDPGSVSLVQLNGDLDPFVDNCEEAQVVFEVANTGTGPLTNVELSGVEVLSPQTGITLTSSFPQSLAPSLGSCAEAAGSFSFRAEGLSFGEALAFRIEVTADELGGRAKTHVLHLMGAESSVSSFASKTFSFESDMEGWQEVTGTFNRTAAGGGADGSSFYLATSANLSDQCDAVQSPPLRLSSTSTLEMSTEIDIEPSLDIDGTVFWFDRANVGVTDVSTGERTTVSPDGGRLYNATGLYGTCGTQNQDGWADSMTNWADSTWSATALGAEQLDGELVYLDVRYGTDADVQGFGLHIDEVTVTDVELVVSDGQPDQCVAGNQAPIVGDDAPVVRHGGATVLDVLANDSDPDVGDALTIIGVTQPSGGTVEINSIGPDQDTLTYIPDGGPGRVDTFQYSVGDGRGGSAIATVNVDFDVILYDNFETGDDSVWSASVGGGCDPDGLYTVASPVQYSCCTIFGPPQVDIDISEFLFGQEGSEITPNTMHYAATLTGSGATCPSGNFSASDTFSGGCTEIYSLDGSFLDEDTWSGNFDMTFIGGDCACLGADPCLDQSFPITATRP